jgi:hypothetical protein
MGYLIVYDLVDKQPWDYDFLITELEKLGAEKRQKSAWRLYASRFNTCEALRDHLGGFMDRSKPGSKDRLIITEIMVPSDISSFGDITPERTR